MSFEPNAYPERITPDFEAAGIVAIHLKRYAFARPHCVDKTVLDAACGVGYGSAYLAEQTRSVLGIDIDADSIAYARSRYGSDRASFECMDLLSLALANASFDAICSFETIEHVSDPERAVSELARVLRDDGVLILSTPHVAETTDTPDNPFHKVELSVQDLKMLLLASFERVELFGQRRAQTVRHRLVQRLDVFELRKKLQPPKQTSRLLGTPTTDRLSLDDVIIDRSLKQATEIIAVCSRPTR